MEQNKVLNIEAEKLIDVVGGKFMPVSPASEQSLRIPYSSLAERKKNMSHDNLIELLSYANTIDKKIDLFSMYKNICVTREKNFEELVD